MEYTVCEMSVESILFNIERQKNWKEHFARYHDFAHVNECERLLTELLAELAFRGGK